MQEVLIILKFDKADTRLAGNPLGKAVFKEQVMPFIDYSSKTKIVFPQHIVKVASSFTQGFFSEIVKEIGYAGIYEKIEIEASSKELVSIMMEDLFK